MRKPGRQSYGIRIAVTPGLDGTPLSNGSATVWRPGDRVMLRGREWTVAQWTPHVDCEALRLDEISGYGSRTFLLPFDRPRRIGHRRVAVVSRRAWMREFARMLLDACPHGGLRDWPCNLDLKPYQLEPALAMLRDGHPRLLIADEVGLGKTIETGLILRELLHRSYDFRALILTPAGLRQQWRDELTGRFGVETISADAEWLRAIGACLPPGINPWSAPGVYLASFDFVKRPEALRPLEDVRWDLLVVDEAHAASIGTDRRAAIHGIALRSYRIVLLTATPPADGVQFKALCGIGATPDDPDIILFKRASVGDGRPTRRSILLSVRMRDKDRRVHRMLERYTTLVWRDARRSGNHHSRLLTTTLRKRALSSIASLGASLRRRRDLLAACHSPIEHQMMLPLDDQDGGAGDDSVADDLLLAAGLGDAAAEQRWLEALLSAVAAASTTDAKSRALVRLLTRIRQPALVFTEYRDTLETLRQHLTASGLSVCVLHGGLTSEERRQTLDEFGRGDGTLLATDAAAEGLNLQRACRVVVHYELPWNPSRMLQRAGRVDRIGQHRRVHEIALVASDTAESLVLAPLARRAMGWSSGSGSGRMLELLTESRVAELVFDGALPHPTGAASADVAHVRIDVSQDALAEAARHERRSYLCATKPAQIHVRREGIPVSVLRRSSWPEGFVLIFDIKTCAADRSVIERAAAAIHVAVALPGSPRTRRQIKTTTNDLLPALRAATAPALEALECRQRNALRDRYWQAAARVEHRGNTVRKAHESVARQLVQAGLFDRRPRRDAGHRHDVLELDNPADQASIGVADLSSSADLRAVLMVTPW
jgi:superfamily II DNA or RNA helicase